MNWIARKLTLPRAATIAACLTGVIAAAALAAAAVESGIGASPFASWLTTKANTATALLLYALALLSTIVAQRTGSPRATRVAQAAVILGIAVVAATSWTHGPGTEFNFDELLIQDDPDGTGTLGAGRMGPAILVSFLIVGALLLSLRSARVPNWIDAVAALPILLVSWLSIASAIYAVPAFQDFPGHHQLGAVTSLAFIVITLGALAARGRSGLLGITMSSSAGGNVARTLFPAVILVPLTFGLIRLAGQRGGLYQTEFGVAMLVVSLTTVLLVIVWRNATSIRIADAARHETTAALGQSRAHYQRLFEDAPVPMYRTSVDGKLLAANSALLEMLGVRDASMIIGSDVTRWYVDRRDRDAFVSAIERDGVSRGQIIQLCRDDGRIIWVIDNTRRVHDALTGEVWYEGGLFDVTERRAATDQVRASERRFRALIENSNDGIALVSAQGVVQYVSPSAARIVGRPPEERNGRAFTEFVHYDDQPALISAFREVLAEPGASRRVEGRYKHADGTWHVMEGAFTNRLEEPDIGAVVVNYRDVTEQLRAVVALRESEARFRQMAEHINEAFFVVDLDAQSTVYVSPTWAEIWGRSIADAYDPAIWFNAIHADDRAAMAASQAAVARGEKTESEFRVVRPDGTTRWVRGRAFPVRNAEGRVYRMVGVSVDVTELRNTQERFTQAQKMEAVGRLAGGVAHDFNNLLMVILTDTDFVRATLPPGSEEAELLAEVRRAGESAVGLTRQLLAFSRKQLVEPVVFNLNDAVTDVSKMLRRLIGEDVRLETKLIGGSASIRADRGQIEQVLTNMAVNARDAMADGGSLTLETTIVAVDESLRATMPDLAPGEYVVLAVSDTGCGMSEETRAHAFEPFFTTKGLGQGTGLGLATCHGIIKQSGGHISLYSEAGVGTTFRIYLPRVIAAADTDAAAVPPPAPRGRETILLVEDDAGVRRVGVRMLRAQGYAVLEARDAVEAQHVMREHSGHIDLLFTDVVLPGVGGRELADQVRGARPGIRVLFTSGYTDDVILRHQLIAHDVAVLQKPYSQTTLSQKVRAVLDAA